MVRPGRSTVRIRRPVEVAVADQEADQLVGRLAAPHRSDDGRRIVGHQCAGQGQQAEPRIGPLGSWQYPGPGCEGAARAHLDRTPPARLRPVSGGRVCSTGTVIPSAARAPAREARRNRVPAPSTEHTAGSGTRSCSRQPPSSRRSATSTPSPAGPARAPPVRGPGPHPAREREMRGGPGPRSTERSPQNTSEARPHGRGRRPACGPARARRLPIPVRTRARSRGRAGDPQHRGAEGGHLASTGSTVAGPAATANSRPDHASADAQRVLECGLVGGGEADAPRVAAHRAGERVDLRPQVGDPEAGHHQGAVPVAHLCTHPWWKTTP